MKKKISAFWWGIILIIIFCIKGNAQESTFNGWLALSHKQKFSEKWSLLSDIQFRSADQFDHIETILIRPGISYNITKRQSVAAGYGFLGNWMEENGKRVFEAEHRIWEQYNLEIENKKTTITNRLRLEQRFIKEDNDHNFAQRLRYYMRLQKFCKIQTTSKKGIFFVLQNEIFLNIQNKEKVNNKFFDQNRINAAIGYRFKEAVELEAGYLYRYQIMEEKMNHHIVQILLSTKL